MKFYNTLSQQKEDFIPLNQESVKIYVCGPTVYDKGHLGHGRSMVVFDVIRRYLQFNGYNVEFVSNYTDIDDKMINRAAEEGVTVAQLAERIIKDYERDFAALNILLPTKRPLATEYVKQMMDLVKKLLASGVAYNLEDGVYFDVTKFADYGKLSKQNLNELIAGARVELDATKRNHQDFVLWKNMKPGEPSWIDADGVLEEGRPGWHIECSAMAWQILGEQIDIHGGGADLIFPHHECELAQSESCFGKEFVKYWLHNGYVRIDGEKMSKSLNNFFTLEDIFREHDPLVVRYALMSTHYRGPIDFSADLLKQAAQSLQRIRDFVVRLEKVEQLTGSDGEELCQKLMADFTEAMDDDCEVSRALAAVFSLITEVNTLIDNNNLAKTGAEKIRMMLKKIDSVFAVIFVSEDQAKIPDEIEKLIKERETARQNKDFALSDKIRDEISQLGYTIEDRPEGMLVKKKLH